jgi:superfamily II DNA/RNA helicase
MNETNAPHDPSEVASDEIATALPLAPTSPEVLSWDSISLSPELKAVIEKAGYTKPTAVQAKAIPLAIEGYDLLVSSQTGSGKTAAFALPMIEKIRGREGLKGLILAPSREIALQSQAVMEAFGAALGIRSIALIGGVELRVDERALETYPQVIIATPGRLCDHIERGNLWLEYLEFLVLDEADRMLELGFSSQLNRILEELPLNRQTLLFSATIPQAVEKMANKMLYQPERIQIGKPSQQPAKVEQNFIHLDPADKFRRLHKLLRDEKGTIFVFVGSKIGVTKVWRSLRSVGFYEATQLHSDLRQKDRELALADFKEGKYRVIIATDVIGRGIHVDDVNHVINYDLPREASDYVHRIGRTGRADASGKATSFVTPKDARIFKDIQKLTGARSPAPASANEEYRPSSGSAPSPETGRAPQAKNGPKDSSRNRKPVASDGPAPPRIQIRKKTEEDETSG